MSQNLESYARNSSSRELVASKQTFKFAHHGILHTTQQPRQDFLLEQELTTLRVYKHVKHWSIALDERIRKKNFITKPNNTRSMKN
jgi:hypothetical protein